MVGQTAVCRIAVKDWFMMVGETAVPRITEKDWFGDGGENGRL